MRADCVLACAFVIARVSSVRFRQCLSAGIGGLTALSRKKSHPHCRKLFSWLEELSSVWLPGPDRLLQPGNYHSNYWKNGKKNLSAALGKYIIWKGWRSKCGKTFFFFFFNISTCRFCLPHLIYPTLWMSSFFIYTKCETDSGQEWIFILFIIRTRKWKWNKLRTIFCNSLRCTNGHKK